MNLLQFIKTLIPHVSKTDILEDIRVTKGELEQVTIPTVAQAASYFKLNKLVSEENKSLFNVFSRNYTNGKITASLSFATLIEEDLKTVLKNLLYIEKAATELFTEDVVTEGMSLKKAIVLRALDQIVFISRFTIDLITYVYYEESKAVSGDQETLDITPAVKARVSKYISIYARLLSVYGNKKFVIEKRLDNLPDVILSDKTSEALVSTYGEHELDPISEINVLGFDGNPIYHIGLLIAEWQADRYKSMKDKKKMLELRLLYLNMQTENKADPRVEKEIEYIQSRIDKIEYKMAKMQKSVETV